MNSVKIEMGAVLSIKQAIFRHDLMKDYINDNDKEPSWDGFIYIYKAESLKAEDIMYRVPVQVKGKNDEKLLKRKFISYPVEYKHLRNYYGDGGVFYIVVALSDDGEQTAIFYKSLTTIVLADLLKGTENKKPEQTKSVVLQRLEKNNSEKLYRVLTQFGMDRKKQGSGNGEIVKKAINIDVMDKVDSIEITSYSAKSMEELFKEIVTGEISLYGHRTDIDMWTPFDYAHQKEIVFKQIVKRNKSISLDGHLFYDSYLVERLPAEGNKPIIRLSQNLVIDFDGGKINFDMLSDLNTLLHDVEFLNQLRNEKDFYVDQVKVAEIRNVNFSQHMEKRMKIVIDLDAAFKDIGFKCNKKFEDFTDANWKSVNELLNLYRGNIKPKEGNEHAWYMWYWDDKVVPLFLIRKEDESIEVVNWFITDKYVIFADKEEHCFLPKFSLFKRDILEKLYDVELDVWVKEINKLNSFEKITPELYLCFIELVAAYDITHNEKYFVVAEMIIDKVLEHLPDDEYGIINKLQLVKRKGELTEENVALLEEFERKTDDPMIKCAVNILLENKRVAKKIIEDMSKENKELLMSYPIYNLL